METGQDTDAFQTFLSAFHTLTESDKAKARQLIISSSTNLTTNVQNTVDENLTVTPSIGDTHSCRICQPLHLTQSKKAKDAEVRQGSSVQFQTRKVYLNRKVLAQGSSRNCLVVKWAVEFLHEELSAFKKELEVKRVSSALRWSDGIMKLSADDLDFIDPHSGVAVQVYCSSHDPTASIEFSYAANPHLLDSLWDASYIEQELDGVNANYNKFARKFEGSRLIKARIFTATGK
jgi:hypothetical protein